MIDLSVIIPVYNASALIERALDSIFKQTTKYNFEVLCIDDGSTDNSVELIEQFSKAHDNGCIRVLRQQNAGPSVARNNGVGHVESRYVTFIDADDYWEDGYIEESVSFLDVHLECVAVTVGCKILVH